jgi:hypothetical protein
MSYYIKDRFFEKIIDEYMSKNTNLIKTKNKNKNNIKFFYSNSYDNCDKCDTVNLISNNFEIGNKRKLFENVGNTHFMPYTLPFDSNNLTQVKFIFNNKKYWIIKPEYGSHQNGVNIIQSLDELYTALDNNKKYNKWILQEYVHNPLLYKNKKFHFRVYTLLRKYDNQFSVFLYPKGYMYVADNEYDINDIYKNSHITASCNNVPFPEGYNQFFGLNEFQFVIYPQLVNIVRSVLKNTHSLFKCPNTSNNCFKFISFDIIPNNDKKLYLMEVNARDVGMASTDIYNKCTSNTPVLQSMEFKTELMNNILNIVLFNKNKDFHRVFYYNNNNFNIIFINIIILFIIIYYLIYF